MASSRLLAGFLSSVCSLCAACGTSVDVGQNKAKGQALANGSDAQGLPSGDEPDTEIPASGDGSSGAGDGTQTGGPSGTGSGTTTGGDPTRPSGGGDPSGNPGNGNGGGGGTTVKLTCFGAAPSLSADFQALCAMPMDERRQNFASAFDLVCNQRRLLNLLLEPCSWTGTGAPDKYRRVLDKTPLDDQTSQDFKFAAAYGVTSQSKFEDQAALILREMTDPTYDAHFVTIRNSKVSNIAPNAFNGYDYSVELANSAAKVSFRSRLSRYDVSPNLTVFFDYAIADKVLIKEHRFFRILVRLDDQRSRMIGLDENLVADGGNHVLAYQNLMDVLMQRMGRDYENSTRD